MNTNYDIKVQEEKYRKITERLFNDLLSGCTNVNFESTPIRCHVDLRISGDNLTYDVEIKQRNEKTYSPTIPLKQSKYNNMLKDHINKKLLYVSIVNGEYAYIFDLSNKDMTQVKQGIWNIKKVQYNPNSEYEKTPMYFLDKEDAHRVVKIDKYI